jgi:hypothetical protein
VKYEVGKELGFCSFLADVSTDTTFKKDGSPVSYGVVEIDAIKGESI